MLTNSPTHSHMKGDKNPLWFKDRNYSDDRWLAPTLSSVAKFKLHIKSIIFVDSQLRNYNHFAEVTLHVQL